MISRRRDEVKGEREIYRSNRSNKGGSRARGNEGDG